MRRVILILVVLGLTVAGIGVYLVATTPKSAAGVALPLSRIHRQLLARVPASAESFALVPTAAALHAELLTNPITRGPVEEWTDKQAHLPAPWMIGRADVVAWKEGKATSYAIRLDPLRAFFVRISMMLGGPDDLRWDGTTLIMSSGTAAGMGEQALAPILRLSETLPRGDALVFQTARRSGDGFPPIGRPAASMLAVDAKEILITSRAELLDPSTTPLPVTKFASGALLSAYFSSPPRVVGDLNRLLGTKVSTLLDSGGAIAIYDIDTGTLLPRPKLVIAAPPASGTTDRLRELAELVGETRETPEATLVSFDRTSLGLYLKDTFTESRWPANRWAMRIDPQRLLPALEKVASNPALRYGTPRIHRSARDLRRWMGPLAQAEVIEAADSAEGGFEVLRVRIASK